MGHKYYFLFSQFSDDECESFDTSDFDDELFFYNQENEENFNRLKNVYRKIDREIEERQNQGKSVERLEKRFFKFSQKVSDARLLYARDYLPPYPRD